MTFLESLLTAQSVGVEEAALLVCMAQFADARGIIDDVSSDKEMTKVWNSRYKKRSSCKTISLLLDRLLEVGAIPTRYSIFPHPASPNMEDTHKVLQEVLELRQRMDTRIPLGEAHKSHFRIAQALSAAQIPEAGFKTRNEAVRTKDDLYVVVDGHVVRSKEYVWDFAMVGKWIKEYGAEFVINTICSLQISGVLKNLEVRNTFQDKQRVFRAYLIGTLQGGGLAKSTKTDYGATDDDDWQ